ncbi:MAG: hypothetical protein IJO45_01875 [Oscillospiraceae bacterium]|nr:hypothetical protein [Oscillospiraceae bacterium]
MESIIENLQSLNVDILSLAKTGGILLLAVLIIGLLGRFIFGKKSVLSSSVSSAIGILFIYAITVILESTGAQLRFLVAPLPLASLEGTNLVLFSFQNAEYTQICSQLLSMVVLSFLVNLADGWLPKGKKLFSWLFFRCLTVVIGYALHLLVIWLFTSYLPDGIVIYAPTILLALLVLMLLTGALKLLVGAALTTINPLIAAFYTFFFANIVGKQITRAILTTALLAGLVMLLNYLGCGVISIATAALVAYIPFAILLILLWFIVTRWL